MAEPSALNDLRFARQKHDKPRSDFPSPDDALAGRIGSRFAEAGETVYVRPGECWKSLVVPGAERCGRRLGHGDGYQMILG
jgi:hypothetical protein